MKIRKIAFFAVIGLLVFSMLLTDVKAEVKATGTLADIEDRGYLIIGSDLTYPPFEELNEETGYAEGFDIDIAHIMADALGVNLSVESSDWVPIIPNLQAKKFDVIISAMTITTAREVEVDFTRWYYKSYQAILVDDANPLNITSELNLTSATKIGLQAGTTSHIWCNDTFGYENMGNVQDFNDILLAIAALKQGSVDVVLGDYAVLAQDELESGETKVVDTYSPEDFGFACRTGDDDLRNALNDALDDLLGADEANPNPTDLYNTLYYEWFGTHAGDVGYTGTVTNVAFDYVWYEAPSGAPGFEIGVGLLAILAVVPIIRKYRK